VVVGVARRGLHPLEHGVGDLGRRGVERRELEVLLLAEVDADQRVEPVQQLLERVDVVDVGTGEPVDARHDRLVVVDIGAAASGKPSSLDRSG
jgi:hypothetical protein